MENREHLISQPEEQPVSEQEKRAQAMARYIETRVVGENESMDPAEEKEIEEFYANLSPREKADALYSKMMAYMLDKQMIAAIQKEEGENVTSEPPDPYLISEIKVLSNDPAVKDLLPSTYGEARLDEKKFRVSEFARLWQDTTQEIKQKEELYQKLERDLHLDKVSGSGKKSASRSRMARLAANISDLEKRKSSFEKLDGLPATVKNTDIVANFQYENFKQYREQLNDGFVWLPSRRQIHKETISALLNHRWPVLIGEAGSGKSEQADAAALELTGHAPTEIECESTTGETQLIKDIAIDPETGGSYESYGPLMRAFTGYDNSKQEIPSVKTGRIARFDESGRLGPKAYSIIKKARQRKPGDDFYGRPVLPGASAIWTSNPVGTRYPDRHAPDPAMRRELGEIYVNYPDMSVENPELYEFALTALLDENNHILAANEELAPAYEKKDIPEENRKVLPDGNVIVAHDEIVREISDPKHGSLWRFCGAVKSLQDSFVYGNAETEKYPDTLLRFKEDNDGNIDILTDGSGEPLVLSTSTVTLGELASWMQGFNERHEKQDEDFRVNTLTEWLNFKINTYLKQADKADKEKLKALFKHFGFLDESVIPDLEEGKPLTPKEIGYLSPRVPRPVYVEKPVEKTEDSESSEGKEAGDKKHETTEVTLEDGTRVLVKVSTIELKNGAFDMESKQLIPTVVGIGEKLRVEDEEFVFTGVVEDENSEHNGLSVGKISGENLHKVFTEEELNWGMTEQFKYSFDNELPEIQEEGQLFWEEECGNEASPQW